MNRKPQKTDGVTAVATPFLHFFSSSLCKVNFRGRSRKSERYFGSHLSILCSQKPAEFPKSVKTREELTEYLTVIIFNASAQHAAVNFGQVRRRADVDQA